MTAPRIGFAGMTHLGLVSAIGAAEKGFDVVGFDPDPELAAALANGNWPVVEPQLHELAAKNATRLRFTADPSALGDRHLVYAAPDVPTDDAGSSDLGPLDALLDG